MVVVGDVELLQRARQLLPSFEVRGVSDDPDLGDPITSLAVIRSMIERGHSPDAVICAGGPGFTLLSQLPHFSASRCFVHPGATIWPPATLQWMAEATGMTLIANLEALPVALLGRGGLSEAVPEGDAFPAPRSRPEADSPDAQGDPTPGSPDYEWANETPVQVPPAPVSLDREPARSEPQVIDAGPAPTPQETAYLPTDLLRPLRPRSH